MKPFSGDEKCMTLHNKIRVVSPHNSVSIKTIPMSKRKRKVLNNIHYYITFQGVSIYELPTSHVSVFCMKIQKQNMSDEVDIVKCKMCIFVMHKANKII